jgi:hypothetical protein
MTSRLLVTVSACALLLAVSAPAAFAGPSFQLAAGARSADGLVDAGGTLHAVWADAVTPNVVRYCEVPRGGTACTNARVLTLPAGTTDEPYLVRGAGATLHVAMARSAQEDAYVWTSADDGATWGAATKVYDGHPCTDESEPVLGPLAGEITFAGWNSGHCVYGAAINGSESAAEPLVGDPPAGGQSNFAVAPTGDGGMVAAADDGDSTFAWRLPPGGDPSNTAAWGGVRPVGAGHDVNVAGGPDGAYVLNEETLPDQSRQIHVSRWEVNGFESRIDVGARESGTIHDLTVGPSGEVAAVWRRGAQDGEPFARLRISRSTNQGGSFGAPSSFATTTGSASRLDVGLAADRRGFALWQDAGATVRAASLDPIAEYVPPATPGPAPPPTGGPTPPQQPPAPKPPAARAVTRTVAVKGGRVTLTGPKGCIRAGGTFVATLKWKRQKRKGNLFVKVRRADFYIGTQRVKIDRRAPFRQTLRVRATSAHGSAIRLRARAFIKVKHGRSPKKSLYVTFRVCA